MTDFGLTKMKFSGDLTERLLLKIEVTLADRALGGSLLRVRVRAREVFLALATVVGIGGHGVIVCGYKAIAYTWLALCGH